MADAVSTPTYSVLSTTLNYTGVAIVVIASFPVMAFILSGGYLLGLLIWRYTPRKEPQSNQPPFYAEASSSSNATEAQPAKVKATKQDDKVVFGGVIFICIFGSMAHMFALINLSNDNYDSSGRLLPGGWTPWQRIGATLFAYVILAAAWILFMAGLSVTAWLIQRIRGRGKDAEASYHKLEDLEPAITQSEPVQKVTVAEEDGVAA